MYRDIMKCYEGNINILDSLELCDNNYRYIFKHGLNYVRKLAMVGGASGGWALEAARRGATLPELGLAPDKGATNQRIRLRV